MVQIGFIDRLLSNINSVKQVPLPEVKLLKKGYRDWIVPEQLYEWKLDVDGEAMLVQFDHRGMHKWTVFVDGKPVFRGRYSDMLRKFPYLFDFIDHF